MNNDILLAVLTFFVFLSAVAICIQAAMLIFRLETLEEAKVILAYHVVGTIMEVFKTDIGSWVYPEASFFRVGGVPLFSGFMYAAIGSYIARCWRLFDFRFLHHPPLWAVYLLAVAIYVNFYTHHYTFDVRYLLFAAAAVIFGRTWIYYKVWHVYRRMPLLVGWGAVAVAFAAGGQRSGNRFAALWVSPFVLEFLAGCFIARWPVRFSGRLPI